jgi:mannitol/fructose-specific phosphotransferase system IIA component (Ntr-type)
VRKIPVIRISFSNEDIEFEKRSGHRGLRKLNVLPVTAEELAALIDPACVLLDMKASTFEECLDEFQPVVQIHQAVVDSQGFLDQVRQREAAVSTAAGEGVAFPHARTRAVSRLFLGIGRDRQGIAFERNSPLVHLIFLIGTPPEAIAEYLGCMALLAARVRNAETRRLLMRAESPEAFLRTITGALV